MALATPKFPQPAIGHTPGTIVDTMSTDRIAGLTSGSHGLAFNRLTSAPGLLPHSFADQRRPTVS